MGKSKRTTLKALQTFKAFIKAAFGVKTWLVILALPWIAVAGFALYLYWIVPSEAKIRGCLTTEMFAVELCPGSKTYVPLKDISKTMRKAAIFAEDANFYNHNGFDWDSIERSLKENFAKGKIVRGGSTISQQLAKNMFLSSEKNYLRKFLEALITYKIEHTLSKDEILERYLNVVEFGKNLYGIKAAAQFYFKKSPAQLNVLESSFLAMVLPNPPKYSRSFFTQELSRYARGRVKNLVLSMHKTGNISEGEYNTAMANLDYFLGGVRPPLPESYGTDPEADREFAEFLEEVKSDKPGAEPAMGKDSMHEGIEDNFGGVETNESIEFKDSEAPGPDTADGDADAVAAETENANPQNLQFSDEEQREAFKNLESTPPESGN